MNRNVLIQIARECFSDVEQSEEHAWQVTNAGLKHFATRVYVAAVVEAWNIAQAEKEEQAEQLTIAKRRISELEKDCDILAYNLDDAHTINKNQVQNCETAYKYAFLMRDLVIIRDAEIERLKSARHMIVSCADRMPTDDDADYNGQVWAMCGNEWHLLCYSNPMFADGRAKMWAATG